MKFRRVSFHIWMHGNRCILKIQNAENCSTPKVFTSPIEIPIIIIHQRLQQALEPVEGELYVLGQR